jgi:predicted GIY-YIG superfamily endonuclease
MDEPVAEIVPNTQPDFTWIEDVGIASHPDERLHWHNEGPCGHTTAHRPWSIVVSIEFSTEAEAIRFER